MHELSVEDIATYVVAKSGDKHILFAHWIRLVQFGGPLKSARQH